jgi:hypothetical protein
MELLRQRLNEMIHRLPHRDQNHPGKLGYRNNYR